jgi:hypothetical protein
LYVGSGKPEPAGDIYPDGPLIVWIRGLGTLRAKPLC